MSLKTVLEKLDVLAKTSSTNEKVEILKEYLQDKTFRNVVCLALDDRKHYNIKQWPPKKVSGFSPISSTSSLITLYDKLDILSKSKGATDLQKYELFRMAKSIDNETAEVVKRIVKKNLQADFSQKLVNKAYPDLIYIVPYMRGGLQCLFRVPGFLHIPK